MATLKMSQMTSKERIAALLDPGTMVELPNERFDLCSSHLTVQGINAQVNDGVVIGKGSFAGRPTVVIATDGRFCGGSIGEIGGAKITCALELALEDNRNGIPTIPIIIFDTGGVRLQEANYGLLAISEMQSALIELRKYQPVIGVIPGPIGCFGGMSITAGLCSYLVITDKGRLAISGPSVIENEAGRQEFDSSNRKMIWDTLGSASRVANGFVDYLASDNAKDIIQAVCNCIHLRGQTPRSHEIDKFQSRLFNPDYLIMSRQKPSGEMMKSVSRGETWFTALAGTSNPNISSVDSVLCCDMLLNNCATRLITVRPNTSAKFSRSRNGEIGLEEGWEIANCVRSAMNEDCGGTPRPIIIIVDSPGQAYGYLEEKMGIFLSCASAVDAYADARIAGHPVISLIVGQALGAAFLAHGLQGNQILALNSPEIIVNAMSRKSSAMFTNQSDNTFNQLALKIPGIAYDISSFNLLGALDKLIEVDDPAQPSLDDINHVKKELINAVDRSKESNNSIRHRFNTALAHKHRRLTIKTRETMFNHWN